MTFQHEVSAVEALDNEVQVMDEKGHNAASLAVELANVDEELKKSATVRFATHRDGALQCTFRADH